MNNLSTKNTIAIVYPSGEMINLFRQAIIGTWTNLKGEYFPIIRDMAYASLLQAYIPARTATIELFMSLGDKLVDGNSNEKLTEYLSGRYQVTLFYHLLPHMCKGVPPKIITNLFADNNSKIGI